MLQLVDCGEQSSSLAGVNGRGADSLKSLRWYGIHPQSSTWNLKMMVSNRNLLSRGWFSGSMLNFKGVLHLQNLNLEMWDLNRFDSVACCFQVSWMPSIEFPRKRHDLENLSSFLEQIHMPFHQIRRDRYHKSCNILTWPYYTSDKFRYMSCPNSLNPFEPKPYKS